MNQTLSIPVSDTLEFIDRPSLVDVQEAEYVRLLGFPKNHVLTDRSRELADWARNWYAEHGRPWIFTRNAGEVEIGDDKIALGGVEFFSDRLREQFFAAQAHNAALVAVSAGRQCEEKAHECWQDGKPDEYFFLEMYGSAVVEHLVTQAAGRICSWAEQNDLAALPHYSPGYTGWPISDQLKLSRIIRGNAAPAFPEELTVMDSGMLRPKKSLLAIFGLTRHVEKVKPGSKLIPCENCSLPGCQYRRASYSFYMPQQETVSRWQNDSVTTTAAAPPNVLDQNARYSTNPRALKKWAQERLHLEIHHDGSVKARFHHDGTTCSNLGQPIQYDYHVRLQPPAQGYRIAEVHCSPALGDVGHTFMCDYLKDPEGFMNRVHAEKPLLDRPLNDILTWKRSSNPAGCHCDVGSREHKWGMVFEVIHFALAQHEKQKANGQALLISKNSN